MGLPNGRRIGGVSRMVVENSLDSHKPVERGDLRPLMIQERRGIPRVQIGGGRPSGAASEPGKGTCASRAGGRHSILVILKRPPGGGVFKVVPPWRRRAAPPASRPVKNPERSRPTQSAPSRFCFRAVRAGPSAAGVFAAFCPGLTTSTLPRKTAPSLITIWLSTTLHRKSPSCGSQSSRLP